MVHTILSVDDHDDPESKVILFLSLLRVGGCNIMLVKMKKRVAGINYTSMYEVSSCLRKLGVSDLEETFVDVDIW